MMWVFEGIELGKWTKRKTFANRTPSSHFRRFNLSLMSCSPAELISVSIEQSKFHFNQLYLQTVEKGNHLPHLVEKLKELNQKLNEYLATNYGIDANSKPEVFKKWQKSHQPFHWFAEFYQIVGANGGFDCIIGNPPYVVYNRKDKVTKKSVQEIYQIQNYETLSTNNLYSFAIERSYKLSSSGAVAMIIPLTSVSNNNMEDLRKLWANKGIQYYSHFEIRPSKLFDGVDQRLTIFITRRNQENLVLSSQIIRWGSNQRNFLFETIKYGQSIYTERIWRFENEIDLTIFKKFIKHKSIDRFLSKSTIENLSIHKRTTNFQ